MHISDKVAASDDVADDNGRYLQWIRRKHRNQGTDFVNMLVSTCAMKFAASDRISQEERARIYEQERDRIQRIHDARLRRHAEIGCCS
jgi:hypothetical protein